MRARLGRRADAGARLCTRSPTAPRWVRAPGAKVYALHSLPAGDEGSGAAAGKVGGFRLHAGLAARADGRGKLERVCRTISRPAVTTRFHGVFAPHSAHRARMTKAWRGRGARGSEDSTPAKRRASMSWAQRLMRVFKLNIETKPGLRRGDPHHRLHRGTVGDREAPRSRRCESGCGAGCAAATGPGAGGAALQR